MAYKLALPNDYLLHPVFHVSYLKLKLGLNAVPVPSLPPITSSSVLNPKPIVVLQHKSKQLRTRTITEVLVKWHSQSPKDATWESLYNLQHQFLTLWAKFFDRGAIDKTLWARSF